MLGHRGTAVAAPGWHRVPLLRGRESWRLPGDLGEPEAARRSASHCRRDGCCSSSPGAVTLPQPHPYGIRIHVDTHMYTRVAALAGRTTLGGRAQGSPRSPRRRAGPGRRRGERRGRARGGAAAARCPPPCIPPALRAAPATFIETLFCSGGRGAPALPWISPPVTFFFSLFIFLIFF